MQKVFLVINKEGGFFHDEGTEYIIQVRTPATTAAHDRGLPLLKTEEIRARMRQLRQEGWIELASMDDLAKAIGQRIIVCLEWKTNTQASVFHYYHRRCLEKMPVVLPGMKKRYLLSNRLFTPVECSGCELPL
jgi:hypothetical protein